MACLRVCAPISGRSCTCSSKNCMCAQIFRVPTKQGFAICSPNLYTPSREQARQEVQKEQHPTMNTRIRLIHSVPPSKTEMDFQQEKAAEIRRLPRVSAIPRQILGRVQMHLAGIRMNRAAILIMRTHQILGEEATVKQAQTMDFSTTKRMMFSTLLLPRSQVCLHIFPPFACITFSHTVVHSPYAVLRNVCICIAFFVSIFYTSVSHRSDKL